MQKKPLNYLDFLILTLIFFGYFSYLSLASYFSAPEPESISAASFSDSANWLTIGTELVLLAIAYGYLYRRQFDFSRLSFSVNKMTLPLTLALVLIGGLISDAVLYGSHWLLSEPSSYVESGEAVQSGDFFAHINGGLLLFALVNGFFEELFFMGLAFAVKSEDRRFALITSVLIRFIFHLYQGFWSAFAIAAVGLAFIFIRQKITSITPFILAHALFDLFGAGLLFLWL